MMIELLNEVVNDVSPFYLYISILLTIVSTYQFLTIDARNIIENNNILTREYHNLRVRLLPMQELFGECREVIEWLIKKTNRIASPDDDTDNESFSFQANELSKRGGQQWIVNLYSHSLRNIV
ncbi:MAG: hypothetical protein ACQEWU_09970 [Bacillota bacterium]|uniref:Uncharacterized protein n=2 Tax=Virgibacillus TaxID=84406 RepID=A0A941DQM4_9BACI|nr:MULTISPECIES: hypothetical protein [Bacillaceae]MBR7794740.1 hypothetical protein [Virgibacillus salarius]MCC2249865.1 hypothetical protein [Virgibacillus sp. AGTR]NAZ07460.1 hypothetical protein [Agaribacter marinus]WBX80993.1 hypothetical protein PD280_04185 [Virgibacillus salarius]